MAFIDWAPEFSVGSPFLDQQHKALIAIINQLHAAMLCGRRKEDMQRIFHELILYTESHFQCEEGMMRQAVYPRLVAHHMQHVGFVQKVRGLHSQVLAEKFNASTDLSLFLKTWLSEHILISDQLYVPSLNAAKSPVATPVEVIPALDA